MHTAIEHHLSGVYYSMVTQGAVSRSGNSPSLCVILKRLLSNVHMKPITHTPLEGDKCSVYTFYDSRGET